MILATFTKGGAGVDPIGFCLGLIGLAVLGLCFAAFIWTFEAGCNAIEWIFKRRK